MAAGVKEPATIAIRLALEDLNSAFAYFLDHGQIDELVDLFCVDAVYTHGARRSNGRGEIEALFRYRGADTPRTSRHLYSGLRLEIQGRTKASGTSCWLTFAADGIPPLPATPLLVADMNDIYRRCDDGKWRFQERHIERIFTNPASPGPVGLPEQ